MNIVCVCVHARVLSKVLLLSLVTLGSGSASLRLMFLIIKTERQSC